jgi:hypothetical protein
MRSAHWLVPALLASTSLFSQSMGDLNGLLGGASNYVHQGLASTHFTQSLQLAKVTADNGGDATHLMTRGVDAVHWNFFYRIVTKPEVDLGLDQEQDAAKPKPKPKPGPRIHHAVLAECNRGIYGGFKYSGILITDVKPLENTWIAVSMDDAIAQLNANGYVRGFAGVELMRPSNPNVPDEYVYVFDCPWERTKVAISSQTGALAWSAQY